MRLVSIELRVAVGKVSGPGTGAVDRLKICANLAKLIRLRAKEKNFQKRRRNLWINRPIFHIFVGEIGSELPKWGIFDQNEDSENLKT